VQSDPDCTSADLSGAVRNIYNYSSSGTLHIFPDMCTCFLNLNIKRNAMKLLTSFFLIVAISCVRGKGFINCVDNISPTKPGRGFTFDIYKCK